VEAHRVALPRILILFAQMTYFFKEIELLPNTSDPLGLSREFLILNPSSSSQLVPARPVLSRGLLNFVLIASGDIFSLLLSNKENADYLNTFVFPAPS
jgi:hypothetical protein